MDTINKVDLNFLSSYYKLSKKGIRNTHNRSYEFAVLNYNNSDIIFRLLKWFELKTGLKLKSYETHLFIHYYQVGDYFGKHRDSIEIGANNRAYVVGFNINDDYEGGDYILYNPDEMINKTAGIPYYFKSDREHEITKVKRGIRKSAVLFINYENLYIEKNLL